MKLISSTLLIFLPFWVFSQNSIIAEYLHSSSTSNVKMLKSIVLYANQEKAKQVHLKPKLDKGFEYGASLEDDGNISIIEKPGDFNNIWYYLATTKDIIKSVTSPNTDYIVYDTNLDYNWEITNKVDTIGNYQVVKATTSFRGRGFTAWFAPSIPIGFGPWKLKGLPGLILNMYDEEKNYTWRLVKLHFNEELTERLELTIPKDAKEMTYQEALNMTNQENIEKHKRINSKLGVRGGSVKTIRHRERELERSFEWETE